MIADPFQKTSSGEFAEDMKREVWYEHKALSWI